MKFFSLKKNWVILALLLLSSVIFISHTFYVIKTHQYPEQDEHVYLSFAIAFLDIFRHPSKDALLVQIIQVNRFRQPLYGLFLAFVLFFTGTTYTYKIALWLNVVFYIATIIGTYLLGREFFTKKTSFLASYIFAFYGFPLFYLHFTYSETAVTAFVVFTLLFLAKSKNFLNRKNTIFFSIFFLLGSLVRWVVPLLICGSLTYSLIFGIVSQFGNIKKEIKKILLNFTIFIFIGVLIPFVILYLPNIFYFRSYIGLNANHGGEWMRVIVHPDLPGIQDVFSIHSIMFYFNILSEQTVFFFIIFVFGLVICCLNFKKYGFLALGFILSYCFFTFGSPLKFDRYIVPIYPFMALISAAIFDFIKNKKIKLILIAVSVVIAFLNFLAASWAIGPMGRQGLKDVVLPSFFPHPRRIYLTPMVWPPSKEELNANRAINLIEKDFASKKRKPFILKTFVYHPYDNALHNIAAYEKINQFTYITIYDEDSNLLLDNLKKADYVLFKDKKPIDKEFMEPRSLELYKMTTGMRSFNDALNKNKDFLPNSFILLAKIPLPLDRSDVLIYKRIHDISQQDWHTFWYAIK